MGGAGVDARFKSNALKALIWGVKLGFYHLFRADAPGATQAAHALATILPYDTDYDLAIDVEPAAEDVQISPQAYAEQLAIFIQKFQTETGKLPVIYTGAGAWSALLPAHSSRNALFRQCRLWVANFGVDKPLVPSPWIDYWLWQFTSSGRVDGINGRVDLNRLKP